MAPPPNPRLIQLFFDGSAQPNPGKGGWGVHIPPCSDFPSGVSLSGPIPGTVSNNVAEYIAVIQGLHNLHNLLNHVPRGGSRYPKPTIEILGDSQLVIEQLKGNYQVRSGRLKMYHKIAKDFLGSPGYNLCVESVVLRHVDRSLNKVADGLTQYAAERGDQGTARGSLTHQKYFPLNKSLEYCPNLLQLVKFKLCSSTEYRFPFEQLSSAGYHPDTFIYGDASYCTSSVMAASGSTVNMIDAEFLYTQLSKFNQLNALRAHMLPAVDLPRANSKLPFPASMSSTSSFFAGLSGRCNEILVGKFIDELPGFIQLYDGDSDIPTLQLYLKDVYVVDRLPVPLHIVPECVSSKREMQKVPLGKPFLKSFLGSVYTALQKGVYFDRNLFENGEEWQQKYLESPFWEEVGDPLAGMYFDEDVFEEEQGWKTSSEESSSSDDDRGSEWPVY
ncbi:hypothetical protein HDV05_006947 [Chytridiales sp. JEL 0842]|nr:hypothetical protein HDV05_006947 [Chytridiales sp. JEL 0842]